MSVSDSPRSRRRIASLRWCGVSLHGRPKLCPRALAGSRPSPVRARINSRSSSAKPPSTVSINRPCAVVVSAHTSARDRNSASLPLIDARVLRRSRVERAKPVEASHHHHVAEADFGQQPATLWPVGLGSVRHFPKHPLGSSGAKLTHLRRPALSIRRYSCVPVDHRRIVQ
jgi:hypothetical protein